MRGLSTVPRDEAIGRAKPKPWRIWDPLKIQIRRMAAARGAFGRSEAGMAVFVRLLSHPLCRGRYPTGAYPLIGGMPARGVTGEMHIHPKDGGSEVVAEVRNGRWFFFRTVPTTLRRAGGLALRRAGTLRCAVPRVSKIRPKRTEDPKGVLWRAELRRHIREWKAEPDMPAD